MSEPLLEIDHLAVTVPTSDGSRRIISDVTLHVMPGESLGLVGESGSGKSMTMRSVMRMLPDGSSVGGRVIFAGGDVYRYSRSDLRRWRMAQVGMIYQDPRAHINPVHTIGDFLTEALRAQRGVDRRHAALLATDLLRQVGISDADRRMRQYPHQLSGGLLQRVMIAAALLSKPRLLIADEPTTALDVTTQAEVITILDRQRHERDMAMVFITHDLDLAAAITDRILVLYAGAVAESGPSSSVTTDPKHPYTAGLLASRPGLKKVDRLSSIPGRPASAYDISAGCPFADRCPYAQPVCATETPTLRQLGSHMVACHRAEELYGKLGPSAHEEVIS